MSLMGYTKNDVLRMQDIISYSAQDAHDNQDKESYKYLCMAASLLEGLLEEGRI